MVFLKVFKVRKSAREKSMLNYQDIQRVNKFISVITTYYQ